MSTFTRHQIETLKDVPEDIKAAKEWVSEVSFRMKMSCKTIKDIFELKEAFSLETEAMARAAMAETKVLTGILSNAMASHDSNPHVLELLSDAYHDLMPKIDDAVKQYQAIKKWFDN